MIQSRNQRYALSLSGFELSRFCLWFGRKTASSDASHLFLLLFRYTTDTVLSPASIKSPAVLVWMIPPSCFPLSSCDSPSLSSYLVLLPLAARCKNNRRCIMMMGFCKCTSQTPRSTNPDDDKNPQILGSIDSKCAWIHDCIDTSLLIVQIDHVKVCTFLFVERSRGPVLCQGLPFRASRMGVAPRSPGTRIGSEGEPSDNAQYPEKRCYCAHFSSSMRSKSCRCWRYVSAFRSVLYNKVRGAIPLQNPINPYAQTWFILN